MCNFSCIIIYTHIKEVKHNTMRIGERIRITRIKQGLTIDELASRLGKNKTTVYRYENGDIENLPLGILDSLASALNTTPAYLMGWSENYGKGRLNDGTPITPEMAYLYKWFAKHDLNSLTEDECVKVLEYAKFLISQRDK